MVEQKVDKMVVIEVVSLVNVEVVYLDKHLVDSKAYELVVSMVVVKGVE